jgi:hypothetical protein
MFGRDADMSGAFGQLARHSGGRATGSARRSRAIAPRRAWHGIRFVLGKNDGVRFAENQSASMENSHVD